MQYTGLRKGRLSLHTCDGNVNFHTRTWAKTSGCVVQAHLLPQARHGAGRWKYTQVCL